MRLCDLTIGNTFHMELFQFSVASWICASVSGIQSVALDPSLVLMPSGDVQYKAIDSFTMVACHGINVAAPITAEHLRWLDPSGQVIAKELTLRTYTEFAKGTLMLLIKNTTKRDLGVYTCEADYEGQKLQTSFELNTFMDLTWVDVPAVQHPRVNSSGYIRCVTSAEPAPEVDWLYNNNKMMFKDGDRCQQTPEGLHCQPILKEDDGTYTCRARVMLTGKIEFREIVVEVYTPPKIQNLTESMTVIEDERVILSCFASGDPQPFYSWEDKTNANLKGRPGYTVDESRGTLIIERVSREDNGVFQCVANNSAGEDTKQLFLTVVVKPKIVRFENTTAVKNQKGKISCTIEAEPISSVEFLNLATSKKYSYVGEYDEESMPEERVHISRAKSLASDGPPEEIYSLEFSSVQRSDDSMYKCTASNKGGSASAIAHLQVQYAPEFTSTRTAEWSWVNNYVNLTCSVSAIPNASISWTFQGHPVEEYSNMKLEEYGNTSVLNILPTDAIYFGQYVCKAMNRIGENDMIIELNFAHVPGNLKQVVISATATTITATIYGPEVQAGFPVTHYAVEYKKLEDAESMRRLWNFGTPYILEKLEPQKQYHFRFAAVNKVGDGQWWEDWWGEASFTMPAKASPVSPPITSAKEDMVTQSPSATWYHLSWDVPADNGEKIFRFEINYCEVRNSSGRFEKISDWISKKIPYPGETSYSIDGLKPDSYYKIEVRAENLIGWSVPSNIIIQTARDPNSVSNPMKGNRPSPLDKSSEQVNMAGVSLAVIVAIAFAILIVVLVIVDVSCYFANKCGVLMFLCVHVCKKHPPSEKVKEANMEEGVGKNKDSQETKMVANSEPVPAEDDEAKDATEETPMIDGKNKKGTDTITALENDTNKTKDSNAVAV